LYVHLLDNPNLVHNHYFNQGDELGQLKTGNFNYNCGYGEQGANWFHVHWAFPDTGVFQAGGWTLDWRNVPADQLKNVPWQRGTERRGPQQWFLADPITSPTPVGWHVEYFSDKTLTNRCYDAYEDTPHLSKPWGNGSPAAGCPSDDFSARFARTVNLAPGCYRFTARADDGLRLWVNNQLLFDQWWEQDAVMQSDLYLFGGAVPLKAEYYERGWGAILTLAWQQLPDETCARVGPDLHPYSPVGWAAPLIASPVPGSNVSGVLVAGQPAYFDWHVVNDGLSSTSNDFSVELWIDGERRAESTYTSIEPGIIGSAIDRAINVATPGWHTVKLVIDPANSVPELNETNNTWISIFYWQPAAQVNWPVSLVEISPSPRGE
jgi:hypothetical protein